MGVQQEVSRSLQSVDDFIDVPVDDPHYKLKTSGTTRDSLNDGRAAWVVADGNYISARWPGDAHTLALTFLEKLKPSL
jgi:putative intracellular protease/amidase